MAACHEGVVDRHLLFLQQWKGLMERCHSIRPSQGIAWGPSAYQDSPGDDAEIQRQTKRSECQICIPEPNTTMKPNKASQEQPENQSGCATVETHDEDTTLYNVHIYTHLMNNTVFDQGTPKLDVYHQESPVSAGPKKNLLRWRWSLRRSKSCWCRNPAPEGKDSSLHPISQETALKSVVQLFNVLRKTMQFCHCHCNSEVNDVECILATVYSSNKSITVTVLFFNSMEKWNLTTKSGDSSTIDYDYSSVQ